MAIAVAGIAFAFVRLKPAALVPKSASPEATGFAKVLEHKYYVDEAYDRAIVQPVVDGSRLVLWKGVDVGIIDGLFVNGSALVARALGWIGSQLQSGPGRHLRVGPGARRDRAARRVRRASTRAPPTIMNDFLTTLYYNAWILPALLLLPLTGAAVVWLHGRVSPTATAEQA